MRSRHPALPYDPNRLLDTLAKESGVTTDKGLARILKMPVSLVRNMRSGRQSIRTSLLLLMAESLEKNTDELRLLLGDKRQKMRM